MLGLAIIGAGYPFFVAVLMTVDRLSGWQIAEAFGKERPS